MTESEEEMEMSMAYGVAGLSMTGVMDASIVALGLQPQTILLTFFNELIQHRKMKGEDIEKILKLAIEDGAKQKEQVIYRPGEH